MPDSSGKSSVLSGRWLPLVGFLAGAASQWPPVVTNGYVRTDIFVLTVIIASAAWSVVAVTVVGALAGIVLLLSLSGFDPEVLIDFGIALGLSLILGSLFRYLNAHAVWRRPWLGFLCTLGVVLAATFVATLIDESAHQQSITWRWTAQRMLPLLIAALLAGAWVFVGRSPKVRLLSTRGWPLAFLIVSAAAVAAQGVLLSWTSQENDMLAQANKTVSGGLISELASDGSAFSARYKTSPNVPWSSDERFSRALRPVLSGSPALIAAGLLEATSNGYEMRYAIDRNGDPAPQVASELGAAPTDKDRINAISEHQTLLGLREVPTGDNSELSAIYAAPQSVPAGTPAQILTVAESLPKAFRQAIDGSMGLRQTEFDFVLALKPSPTVPVSVQVAEQGQSQPPISAGVEPVSSELPFGNETVVLTASPGENFGIDQNTRRATLLGLLLLAGSALVLYFRGLSAADALESSESRYRLLAENSADVVLQHAGSDRVVRWASPSLVDVLGWTPDAVVGKPLDSFIHPDDLGVTSSLISTALDSPDVAPSGEVRFSTAEGGWRWMSAVSKAVEGSDIEAAGAGILALRDIQDSVDSRQALERSESLFRTSMESAAIGMAIARLDGSFIVVNQSLCTMLKFDEAELLSRSVGELVHEDSIAYLRELGAQLVERNFDSVVEQVRLVRSDGVELWARTAVARVPSTGEQHDVYLLQIEDITDEREARDLLAFRAFHDPLTGLRNRAWILDSLATDLEAAGRKGTSVGVLFVDLDHFKVVNDSLGHAAGDDYLVTVAERIKGSLRSIDRVGRFGGDEFVVVFPDVDNPRQLENAAERISSALGADLHLRGHRMVPSASIGIALSTPASTPDSLLRDADSALYRAKYAGRARWQFFDKEMHEQALSRLTTEDELRDAIARKEFVVHYQPIVRLADGELAGYEALIRWEHPTAGLMMPSNFLDVAEASGLIAGIGPLVLEQVCRDLANHPEFVGQVSLNVSAVELAQANWGKNFNSLINNYFIDPERLIIEMTETAVLDMLPTTKTAIRALTSRGVGLHLDDFGTGFSSISILRDLPVTGVKLDRRFVQEVSTGGGAANALSRGLAGLVNGLDLSGIAEGVESSQQARVLADQGWTYGQGYYFGRPGPMPDVHEITKAMA